ncbi:recombinase family protein [Intestinimonas sp.]|uniref:recombinase family protein n=1 Tax=Intestinimonas sp. TaxID=1965293 RepID=UPI003AAFC2E7
MRVWLYYRLSRDEDDELNSLTNQRKIIYDYAVSQGHEIVGESSDDNVSGMHFNREGIDKIYDVVEQGRIDAIIVKDLSRLGRHRTQTALFIDYLREHDVRVLSATENIDTFNENDDLIIGFKGLVNDFYARDGSRRVRTGYRQKQKEGIVITPPFGYFKDKNTKQVVVVEEAAETVRYIFSLYLSGHGMKAIARQLNDERRKTPAQIQLELLRKRQPHTRDHIRKKNIWDSTMVSRILQDEIYTGTLICHKSERNKINKTFRFTEPEEQFRHEDFLPAIVTKEMWREVQNLINQRKAVRVRAGSGHPVLRYSGLLRCSDCGRTFVGKRVKLKSGERVEYICDTYLRYGKEHCSSHVIREELLDQLITEELRSAKRLYQQNWDRLQTVIDRWIPQQPSVEKKCKSLLSQIDTLEEEMEVILMERIRDKANVERYDRMIQKREAEITSIKKQLTELESLEDTLKTRQTELKRDIRMMDDILAQGNISESNLRLLVEKIYISEHDGKLDVDIHLKAPFRTHVDFYEKGEVVESGASLLYDYDRLGAFFEGGSWEDDEQEANA